MTGGGRSMSPGAHTRIPQPCRPIVSPWCKCALRLALGSTFHPGLSSGQGDAEFEFTGIQQTACIPRARAAPTFQPLPVAWRRALWFSLTSGLCHRLSTVSHTPPVGACTPAKLDRALLPGTSPPLCACNLESMSPPSRRIPALLSPGPTFSARLSGSCAVRSGVSAFSTPQWHFLLPRQPRGYCVLV